MKKIKQLITLCILTIIMGCESDFGTQLEKALYVAPPYVPTVYLSGSYLNAGSYQPCYWVEKTRTVLPLATSQVKGVANSIYKQNDTLYTTGYERGASWLTDNGDTADTTYLPGLWNGSSFSSISLVLPVALPAHAGNAGTSILFNGNDSYVSGFFSDYEETGEMGLIYAVNHPSFPCYWKNGQPVELPYNYGSTAYQGGYAYSLSLYNSKIYIAGSLGSYDYFEEDRYRDDPCYWISDGANTPTVQTLLSGTITRGRAYSIFVENDTIHVAGRGHTDDDYPYLWTNGNPTQLSTRSGEAMAVTKSGSGIFIAGYIVHATLSGITIPCLWINGAGDKIDLGTGSAYNTGTATGLAVYNSIVYISGYYLSNGNYVPCYWTCDLKNSRKVSRVVVETTTAGKALGIFVK